jgi:hypothetical protein
LRDLGIAAQNAPAIRQPLQVDGHQLAVGVTYVSLANDCQLPLDG